MNHGLQLTLFAPIHQAGLYSLVLTVCRLRSSLNKRLMLLFCFFLERNVLLDKQCCEQVSSTNNLTSTCSFDLKIPCIQLQVRQAESGCVLKNKNRFSDIFQVHQTSKVLLLIDNWREAVQTLPQYFHTDNPLLTDVTQNSTGHRTNFSTQLVKESFDSGYIVTTIQLSNGSNWLVLGPMTMWTIWQLEVWVSVNHFIHFVSHDGLKADSFISPWNVGCKGFLLKLKDNMYMIYLPTAASFQTWSRIRANRFNQNIHSSKLDTIACFLKLLWAYFQWDCSRSLLWMSAVFFFHACVYLLTLCALFVCSSVLQKGPGGFLHRLLVSNRAQHTLRLPGEDTYSGETACTHVHSPDTTGKSYSCHAVFFFPQYFQSQRFWNHVV